ETESETAAATETESETAAATETESESETESSLSYAVPLTVTLNVLDRDGTALAGSETFYVDVYADEAKTQKVNVYTDSTLTTAANSSAPIAIAMDGGSTQTVTFVLEATAEEQTFYIGETDSTGAEVAGGVSGFAYNVSYPDTNANAVTVRYGDTAAAVTVQNQLIDSTVKISVRDSSDGGLLSGAKLAIKDSSGKIYEVSTVGSKTFTSGETEIVWTNALTDGETYYLTEITAPDGYTPVPDVAFTVVRGCTTEVAIENAATVSTDYKLTVTKQVYVGDYQVYAYDTTSGTYQAKGAYTYYFALFSDSARTKKVSNVVSLDVSGFTGTVTFSDLTENGVYYLSETDQYGIVKTSTSSLTIRYTNSGKVTMSDTTRSMVAQNVYTSLPGGYRYTGTLSLTLNVTDSSGTAEAVTNTFYLGIYRNSDYSDTPTIVKMSLSNASSVTVRRRILLSGENSMTYYIAEVDSSGTRITDSSTFSYVVSVDKPTVTISKGSTQSVTVTNKLKASKVTLYLTKRVYEGTTQKAVSETFYVGLFKDEDLTELYADPIAMTLDNASEKTLKLTLNLGSASGVTIYIAEVDKDGNVITDQRSFGYQIKVVNATAAFTQDNLSIQTVLLNSVYGTTSSDDWDTILNSTSSDLLSDTSSYTVSDNGSVSGETTSVETGDNTPLFGYVLLMGAAFLVLAMSARRRRRFMQ
ncbi:MAG: prealbumin-like fold domain-containing protein, partial [Lachnospiraceae bacterium]|nr:prealbumin-like fold domain-containing protein [Lachnospiraceae bacterium]